MPTAKGSSCSCSTSGVQQRHPWRLVPHVWKGREARGKEAAAIGLGTSCLHRWLHYLLLRPWGAELAYPQEARSQKQGGRVWNTWTTSPISQPNTFSARNARHDGSCSPIGVEDASLPPAYSWRLSLGPGFSSTEQTGTCLGPR